jgi:hypothetical protein
MFYLIAFCLLLSTLGCDSFIRKFTRKPKQEIEREKEIVLIPEEYKSNMTKEEYYRQYFLYWKSWQEELIEALAIAGNHKKQVDCAIQAITNLVNMRKMLNEEKQKKLDTYINRMNELKDAVANDVYSNNALLNRQKAEQLRRDILKGFSYNEIKTSLI